MYVEYGDTPLRVIELLAYERENVYTPDGADLLYVRHMLDLACEYAPGGIPSFINVTALSPDTVAHLTRTDATAAVLARAPRGANPGVTAAFVTPPAMDGGIIPVPVTSQRSGPETDAELRYRLLRPRQKLILWAYDRQTGTRIAWLESPRPGFSVDAANGPKPIACDVVSAQGEPLAIGVHFQVETFQAPCPTGSDRLILAHRWQVTHGHDEHYYLTRVIQGEITFHSGVQRLLNIHPDRLRSQFLHPIPLGFRRGLPEITQSSDGLTIKYTITDTDPTIVFAPGESGATHMDILEKFQYVKPPIDTRNAGDRALDFGLRVIT